MSFTGSLTSSRRHAILADYRRKKPTGEYRYSVERVADRNGVTPAIVDLLRAEAGVRRNGQHPALYGCPICSFRALHPLGHALCLGDEALADIEVSQALLVASASVDLREEEMA